MTDIYRVACAAGFSGDRTDVAKPLVEELLKQGGPSCLIFESLAERTLALAQLERHQNADLGYEPLLSEMLEPVLADCIKGGIPIIGNFGAANPEGAARLIAAMAKQKGLSNIKIAIVQGDDVSAPKFRSQLEAFLSLEDRKILAQSRLVSANVYLGAQEIAKALMAGAQVVVTGRVADPALTVGPLMAYFKKDWTDWDFLGAATMAGHLLECGSQVTGGYFADPGIKDVPGLAHLGFPIVEFDEQGNICVTKPSNSGGLVNRMTVTEQLLYELHDPANYLTPDVIADITQVQIKDLGGNRVGLTGVKGHSRPTTLKANVCIDGGWLAEAEISYAGFNAYARAQLAAQIIRERLSGFELRIDFIGSSSVFASDSGEGPRYTSSEGFEDIRMRVATAHHERSEAQRVCREVTALYTCGPAGGGGVRTSLKPRLNTLVCLIPRELVHASYEFPKSGGGAMDKTIPLYKLAHARTGDKGNRSNISVIAYRPEDFSLLQKELTEEKVKEHFGFRNPSSVKRFELPNLMAFNFVIDDVLDGGVNLSLNLDSHGKSLSYWLLAMEIHLDGE